MKPRACCAWAILAVALATGPRQYAQQADPSIASQPARPSPEWLKSGVIYQIFVRSFSPAGDLNGVTARLDDLQSLHVNILWLMPIHPDGQVKKKGSLGSPYAVRDYYAIDAALGTKDDLRRLIQEAHRRQMKVILDMVANHTSWDSVMMAHPEFYKKDKEGHVTYPYDWTDVAALDYSNPTLRRYMTDVLLYWIKEFDLDGYRCDAAAEIPTDFWEQTRTELDKVKPDIVMLAEAEKPELLRSAFDIDYAWPLMHAVDDVVMSGAPATSVQSTVEQQRDLVSQGRPAHAHERRSRRVEGDHSLRIPGSDCRIGAHVHAGWSALDLQRNGGWRLDAVARPGALRAAKDILGRGRVASRVPEILCRHCFPAPGASGAAAGQSDMDSQLGRTACGDLSSPLGKRGISHRGELVEHAVSGNR